MKIYTAKENYTAEKNSIIDTISIADYAGQNRLASNAWINTGAWQSWNPGFEVAPNKKQPRLHCNVIKNWTRYITFPESSCKPSKNIVLGHFIVYLRWDDFYLVFASVGNIDGVLPPVQFITNRKENTVSIELCDKGKKWEQGEPTAKIEIFTAESYFECKDKLRGIFGSSDIEATNYAKRFEQIAFLGKNPLGWESWYNHYANIDEKLIQEDLKSLKETKNILNLKLDADKITATQNKTTSTEPTQFSSGAKNSTQKKIIFQVDDGWEKQLGNWESRDDRFPDGMAELAKSIENQGYIPGLWIAPFIIDLRSPIAQEHPDWLLRDKYENLIGAGYNPLWGVNGTFYCFDLSNNEVLDHLDKLLDTAVNDWGFRYLKLDFLYAGMIYGNFKNGGAAYEWYSRAIKKLTNRRVNKEGLPVCYLGCGIPLEASFNDFPLSRIGCDTLEHWENKVSKFIGWNGRNSAYLNLKDTLGHAMWDKIIFANDPDVLFVRNENCTLTREEKILISTVDALFASQLMYSDDPAKSCSEEEIALAKEMLGIMEKYKNEEFGVKNTSDDEFEIFTRSGRYSGSINLGKTHSITWR
ncbi:MAG: alpha-galactosidase [Treponema sp.]|nr:alpha-galactosidase [Treponema sp.]